MRSEYLYVALELYLAHDDSPLVGMLPVYSNKPEAEENHPDKEIIELELQAEGAEA